MHLRTAPWIVATGLALGLASPARADVTTVLEPDHVTLSTSGLNALVPLVARQSTSFAQKRPFLGFAAGGGAFELDVLNAFANIPVGAKLAVTGNNQVTLPGQTFLPNFSCNNDGVTITLSNSSTAATPGHYFLHYQVVGSGSCDAWSGNTVEDSMLPAYEGLGGPAASYTVCAVMEGFYNYNEPDDQRVTGQPVAVSYTCEGPEESYTCSCSSK